MWLDGAAWGASVEQALRRPAAPPPASARAVPPARRKKLRRLISVLVLIAISPKENLCPLYTDEYLPTRGVWLIINPAIWRVKKKGLPTTRWQPAL
jgi:hypothetical protein